MKFTLINSHAERREGLKALLRQIDRQGQFNEAKDWRQARHAIARLDPDLIVIDWQDSMRLADLHDLLGDFAGIPAAMLVDDVTPAHVRRLLMAGALGVVPRDIDPQLIVRAFEMVLLGGHYVPAGALALDPPICRRIRHPRRSTNRRACRRAAQTCATTVAAPAADHALCPHGQHQQDDREDARHQRRHGQDPSDQHIPAARRAESRRRGRASTTAG